MSAVQSSNSISDPFAALNASAKSGAQAAASTSEEVQNRFLKLLVTQLQNQDPLNPLDNAAVTNQMSQISTVTGIERLNSTLETLLSSYRDGQATQAASLIGKNVLVAGSGLTLANGQAGGGVNLAEPADTVMLTIVDAAGKVVQSQNLGARAAGSFGFAWDGKNDAGAELAAGHYGFTVSAQRAGVKVAAETLQVGTVSALVKGQAGFQLEVSGLGRVDFDKVQKIL